MARNGLGTVVVAAAVAAVVAFGVAWHFKPVGGEAHRETAYERVMRTKTLRCGYMAWDPAVMKDPSTGKMSGLLVELMDDLARLGGFKVVWNSEVGSVSTI